MNRKPLIHLGMVICAIAIGSHVTGTMDLGNLFYGFVGVLFMLTMSLTLVVAAEKKGQADG